jgi:hypothetical protein
MGQYYKAIILGEPSDREEIMIWLDPYQYNEGSKLTEHAWTDSNFVGAVCALLCPGAMYYKSRVVWAGDYADVEPCTITPENAGINLYHMAEALPVLAKPEPVFYPYLVNHTKCQYITIGKGSHPLPLLTAEGNGRGGGDYRDQGPVGAWARDVLSVEPERPYMVEIAWPLPTKS